CHTSWNPSCYGCHLPQKAARKTPALHNEGDITRNQVSYNFQTLREDVFMLAKDGNVTGNRIGPSRSSCAIHVTSYNLNREAVYTQQQTISADGLSGIAFSTNVPHTVRGKGETKSCTDCHLSDSGDNNAVLAQLLMQGTNYFNFIGRNCWVGAGDHGLFAVQVTERDEPQSVIGSTMHRAVYPQRWKEHREHRDQLQHAHEHPGVDIGDQLLRPGKKPEILGLQVRGEYAYAACGEGGIRVFDIAFIEHKGFSERIVTAPVSPAGQRFHIPSRFATDIAAPTTIAPDPTRVQQRDNDEASVHPMYAYLYATDLYEGLIMTAAGTLLDGNPLNNFLKKDVVFNPNGVLNGASSITIIGTHAWICCRAGVVIVSVENPTQPRVVRVLGPDQLQNPRAVEAQFRYAFVLDSRGLQVLDITNPENPLPAASLSLADARSLYIARSYAFVAAGKNGLVIVDVETPTKPQIDQVYTAGGVINDARDVKLGITYTSQFAYVADGHNGLRVIQLTSPETPGNAGFNVRPQPMLVASWAAPEGGEIVCVAEGVDRDRAIDEAGNQLAVFGRVGARPLSLTEQRKL
ncbi:MAG: LVIVD repeat-containing protein, partial [Planctomycetaceae bacterium]